MPLHFPFPRWIGWRAITCATAFVAWTSSAHAEDLVTLRVVANPDYVASRQSDHGLRPESFVVMQGQFFSGCVRDRTMERMPFTQVAGVLAHDLRRRQYFPGKDLESADLLLVVHWGVTSAAVANFKEQGTFTDTSTESLAEANSAYIEATLVGDVESAVRERNEIGRLEQVRHFEFLEMASDNVNQQVQAKTSAELLGLVSELRGEEETPYASTRAETIEWMLKEERYFVLVFAFDAGVLRETGRMKRLWTARMSTRAAGINFRMAVDRLSEVGGRGFGADVGCIAFERVHKRTEKIIYGDLEVISFEDP